MAVANVIKPPPYEIADAAALHALWNGTADEHQQKRALQWILNQACGIRDLSFIAGAQDLTAFREGRRFVGLEIVKLVNHFPKLRKRNENG